MVMMVPGGCTFVKRHNGNSLISAVMRVYPEMSWQTCNFFDYQKRVPSWDDTRNLEVDEDNDIINIEQARVAHTVGELFCSGSNSNKFVAAETITLAKKSDSHSEQNASG